MILIQGKTKTKDSVKKLKQKLQDLEFHIPVKKDQGTDFQYATLLSKKVQASIGKLNFFKLVIEHFITKNNKTRPNWQGHRFFTHNCDQAICQDTEKSN